MRGATEALRLQSAEWGIGLDPSQISLLSAYADLLAGYKLANVIGTKDGDKIVLEHLVDALSCFLIEDLRQASSVIDVGTGAGLPGLPLAITRPELRVTLLEAAEKKVRFLKHARAALGLRNLKVLHARVEEVGRTSSYREAFDLATARAVAALPVVLEYCAPLVRSGGAILAMKGRPSHEELSMGVVASGELGLALREVREVKYSTRLPQKERRLVVFDKVRATPDRYPRRAGLAKKRPLGDLGGQAKRRAC
jgi:16S rRNA (guanine527-N7)-methyltransferase